MNKVTQVLSGRAMTTYSPNPDLSYNPRWLYRIRIYNILFPLSAGSTHRKSGREGPIPIPIYTGRSIKSHPSSSQEEPPCPEAAVPMAQEQAPVDRTGGQPLEAPRGGAPAACSFPGENARSWEALGEARPGQSSLSAGALLSRAWAQSWSSAALA